MGHLPAGPYSETEILPEDKLIVPSIQEALDLGFEPEDWEGLDSPRIDAAVVDMIRKTDPEREQDLIERAVLDMKVALLQMQVIRLRNTLSEIYEETSTDDWTRELVQRRLTSISTLKTQVMLDTTGQVIEIQHPNDSFVITGLD